MLAQHKLAHNFKPKIKAKTIHKIVLNDDVLKIEYRNKHGNHDDLVFTDPRHPDLNDLESFLVSFVYGLKQECFNQDFLSRFGKSIYYQLQAIIDPNNTGFGKLSSIRFGRFIIERAFESTMLLMGSKKPLRHELSIESQDAENLTYRNQEGQTFVAPFTEIAFNETLLTRFSIKEQHIIRFAAGETHQKRINPKKTPALKLIAYTNDQAEYQNHTGEKFVSNFIDLAFSPTELDQFSQSDRDLIRFAAGELSKEKETKLRQKQ